MTTSPLASRSATRELLDEFGLATKHRLGQNFLIDNHVIERICELAELTGAECVLEVGPGIGTLTLALVQEAARVVSIEMDPALEPVLDAHAADYPNFCYIMGDALHVEPERIAELAGGAPTHFVANLPYNVAATVILDYFEQMPALERAVVMVQKEVADRIAAQPGSKEYGAYTVKLSLFAQATGRFEVPPRCFMPAPHVDSAVVRLDRVADGPAGGGAAGDGTDMRAVGANAASKSTEQLAVGIGVAGPADNGNASAGLISAVCRVVDAAFAQRRKTIRNSMSSNGFAKDALDAAFAATGIAPTARAETLSKEQFVALTQELKWLEALPEPVYKSRNAHGKKQTKA